ncbi:hypothetical protein BDW59DRAFT_178381 [Aspergillus cavernicola]|uniref:Uncharacterized protein n=1 Tax=Aspergillus cavernicola TaxID=176166 RepID=A0ABR4INS0_9EURO
MSWFTTSTTTDLIDANGSTQILTVQTLSPPDSTHAISTWSIWPNGTTVEVYTTYPAGVALPVTSTIASDTPPTSSTETSTDTSATSTAPGTSGETSTTIGITSSSDQPVRPSSSSTQSPGSDFSSRSSSNGISNGALAGVIVGSIIGTALLTLLLAFLFFRRRRISAAPREAENGGGSNTKSGAIISAGALSGEKLGEGFSLTTITPHPADDETVCSRILTLIDHASLHVDNYYASNSPLAQLSQDASARLAKYNSDILPASLVPILGQRGIQRQAITHVLVYTLLQAIRPGGELLPKLLAAQPQVDSSTASSENALFAWRMVTAYLYKQSAYNKDPTHTTARNQASQALAAEFTTAFAPYALPTFSESDRCSHLMKLANSTAELGIWLFAQPCTFEFIWNKNKAEFTMVPKVIKTFDEHGTRLESSQMLIEAVQPKYPSTT